MTKKVWVFSAIVIVVVGIFLGTMVSDSNLLSFLEVSNKTKTEQVKISEGPWSQSGNLLTTEVSYTTPAGDESNKISIGVENDTITSFEMTIETSNDVSIAYQKEFIAELEKTIIGKKVSQIAQLDTIAGASVTTKAFTDAFAQF